MFEVKPMSVEKEDTAAGTDEGSKVCDGGVGGCGGDTLYLYEGQDWVISPSCSPEEPSAISPMLAEETFRYMTFLAVGSSYPHNGSNSLSKVLSADRVEQMTKTYNDIDVVTHLLAERDRDLELAARIGQSLLQRNHVLQERNDSLEEQLAQAVDQVHQLQHELAKKDELLRMVASVSEESETDSSCSTPLRHPTPTGAALALSQLGALQSKLQELEEENLSLRSEACHLKKETITYEEKEQQLVNDCVKELRESNSQMVSLTDELSQKNEELIRHQEEIAQLLSQIVELQQRVKELALEKEELRIHLQASKEAQRQLTAELKELSDRNAECVGMLHESQEEIKELRSKSTPSAGLRRHLSYGLYPMDSLAAEIEGTMRRELSVEEEIAFEDQRSTHKRVFQTVRSVNQSVMRAVAAVPPIPGSARSGVVMTPVPYQSHTPNTEERAGDVDTTKENSRLGQPGSPGGNDLTSALNRLSLRRQNFLCERQFFQAERERKLQELAAAESEGGGSGCSSPMGSTVSSFSNLSEFSISSSCFKTFLPEKLQIVKPLEGSLTLHHWQQLAKPHLATILDPHPGVVTKGFRPLTQDNVYHLADLEEDEDQEKLPWEHKRKEEEPRDAKIKEEDEEGITFNVRSSSTPEEKRERRRVQSPANVPPLPASLRNSPVPIATAVSLAAAVTLTASAAPAVSSGISGSAASQFELNLGSKGPSIAINPGKYQSSTFSTYTFTTCRILHPSDSTQVTASSACSPSVSDNTPSSLRTGPSTPVTPCRLSLGDSFPVRRPAAPPGGLAKLLLEKGISAQGLAAVPAPKKPLSLRRLPSTPPNSPSHSPCPSPVPFDSRSTSSDNFLASRPAELFLQDVYGLKLGRAPRPDLLTPDRSPHGPSTKPDCHAVNLVEHLRKLGLDKKVLQRSEAEGAHPQESATLLATGGGSLLDGLRRNQSLPAMVGRRSASVSSPSFPVPPPHPTSLALPTPPWRNLNKPRRTCRHASLSQAPPYLHNS
ncbi:trafficking kinesin-binding protein 2 isoform X1 [Sinocyclocheilus grahami]|uniref:Trafficking kinesin protein 2 n=1 Tax=Sinocyclocheilus grahami TaxID=75366 RepID=A0A672QBD0_SINGR|nr:PREDICTED: trafficking kinesin-binding protein 2-like isoform X1 [Sinocyclocheilus grahami]